MASTGSGSHSLQGGPRGVGSSWSLSRCGSDGSLCVRPGRREGELASRARPRTC